MDSGEKPARASGVIHDYIVDKIVVEKLHTLLLRQVKLFLIDAPKRALSSLHLWAGLGQGHEQRAEVCINQTPLCYIIGYNILRYQALPWHISYQETV